MEDESRARQSARRPQRCIPEIAVPESSMELPPHTGILSPQLGTLIDSRALASPRGSGEAQELVASAPSQARAVARDLRG